MSPPMKELESGARWRSRFHHDGNPVLSWCISNVIGKCPRATISSDRRKGDKPVKNRARQRCL